MQMGHKITSLMKGILIVALVAVVAACARTPNGGVGNLGPGQAAPGTQQEFWCPLVTVCSLRLTAPF